MRRRTLRVSSAAVKSIDRPALVDPQLPLDDPES